MAVGGAGKNFVSDTGRGLRSLPGSLPDSAPGSAAALFYSRLVHPSRKFGTPGYVTVLFKLCFVEIIGI